MLGLAGEHRATEALLRACGLPFVLLRNGWYSENYTASVPAALAHGVLLGSAGSGRIASAARADYAAAAAAVLTRDGQAGKPVRYQDLPEAEYKAALLGFGLPEPIAGLLADSDAAAAKGALDDEGHQLSALIGRPTTPLAASVTAALAGSVQAG